ncbi:MAG TPA: hypothetical protein ENN88_00575 [Candidatus Coatesbacteria bacterium]|nr:hypothetical protein [Candidatus Coatesbacteria bacterium]
MIRRFGVAGAAVGVLLAVSAGLTLGGCESSDEEEEALGGCWVHDGSRGVLVLLTKDGEVKAVASGFGKADYMAARKGTGTLWVSDSAAARLTRISGSGTKELYVSGFVSPEALAVDPDSGDVYLSDPGAREVVALDSGGSVLWRSGLDFPPRSLALAGGDGRLILTLALTDRLEPLVYGLEPADGAVVFERFLPHGNYALSADPEADCFWLVNGEALEKRSLADGSLLLTVTGLGSPRVVGAMGDGCWVYDAAGKDLILVDGDGEAAAMVENLPGTPELSTLEDKVWLTVRGADLVALYDSTGQRELRVSTVLSPSPLAAVR